jgi:glycyl-tRNA synthetase
MFIVKKKIHDKEYFYLNETRREGKKVVSTCIAYLGKDKAEAERKAKEFINEREKEIKTKVIDNIRPSDKTNLVKKEISIDELTSFCKRKGFVFKSSEIYGGFSGFWDFGPLGTELLNNLRSEWWKYFVQEKENMVGIEASVLSHPKIWKASGHIASFSDVSVRCKKCKKFNKVDKEELERARCGFCSGELDKASAKDLNLMFKTQIGPVEEESVLAYLRPETAQGMFVNFKQVQETSRKQLPFGIAQIGRNFRNEIAPRDFLFRSREFHIAEFEFFINPEEKTCLLLDEEHLNVRFKFLDAESQERNTLNLREISIKDLLDEKRLEEWHAYWLAEQILWFKKLGLWERIKIREHMKQELSHYSSATFDIDYEFPFGSKEIAGNANRGQYDLNQHIKESGESLGFFDEELKKRVIPKVIEPTFGIERIFLALLCEAYFYDDKRQNIVLKLNKKLAPVKAAIFPIVKVDEKLVKISRDVFHKLKKDFFAVYDAGGSVGRRYSRADEAGIPMCITIDEQTLRDRTVTIRDRDSTEQVRIKISELEDAVKKILNGENFSKIGKIVKTRVK